MSDPVNPFFAQQERVKTLLAAHAYLAAAKILTEKQGDIAFLIEKELLGLGFGLVVATGKGDAQADEVLRLQETLVVSIVHGAALDKTRNVLDALAAAIAALHGAPCLADDAPPRSERERFLVIGHAPLPAEQTPEGYNIHQLFLTAPLIAAFA